MPISEVSVGVNSKNVYEDWNYLITILVLWFLLHLLLLCQIFFSTAQKMTHLYGKAITIYIIFWGIRMISISSIA